MNKIYEETKFSYKIELDTMNDIKEFVAAATACDDRVMIKTPSMTVNAKSLLGVVLARKFSWNGLEMISEQDHYYEFRKFIIE